MKIQNIFNFGLILLISAALMLSGCAKEEDSSTSTAESGGGSSDPVSQVVTLFRVLLKLLAVVPQAEVRHRLDPPLP